MNILENLPKNVEESFEKVLKNSDKNLLYFTYTSFLFSNILGLIYGKFTLSIWASIFLTISFIFIQKFFESRFIKNVLISPLWGAWVTLIISISEGLLEMQFLYFIYLFTLITYRSKIMIIIGSSLTIFYNTIIYLFILNNFQFGDFIKQNFLNSENLSFENYFWTSFWYIIAAFVAIWLSEMLKKRTLNNLLISYKQERELKLFEKNKRFAEEISKGNFSFEYIEDKNDELGKTLNSMRKNLNFVLEKEKKEKVINEFINKGVKKINSILRMNYNNLEEFSYEVISELIHYLKANQGAIFIVEDKNPDDIYLSLKSMYAYERRKYLDKKIKIGEGLIGTMYLEKKFIYLTEIPKNYIKIKSGIGKASPRALVVSPLIHNKEIIGILEIASFNKFTKQEIKLIKLVSEYIAAAIISTKIKQKTEKLLIKSNQLTEEMKEKEEELKQNMEELETTQEKSQIVIDYLSNILEKNNIKYKKEFF